MSNSEWITEGEKKRLIEAYRLYKTRGFELIFGHPSEGGFGVVLATPAKSFGASQCMTPDIALRSALRQARQYLVKHGHYPSGGLIPNTGKYIPANLARCSDCHSGTKE